MYFAQGLWGVKRKDGIDGVDGVDGVDGIDGVDGSASLNEING